MSKFYKLKHSGIKITEEDFNYDYTKTFGVKIEYTFGDYIYLFYDNVCPLDLDYKRTILLTGILENDIEVFYKQTMSKILSKFGKLRPGEEIVFVDGIRLYNTGKEYYNFRYEKELDSYNNRKYIDETIKNKHLLFFVNTGEYYAEKGY